MGGESKSILAFSHIPKTAGSSFNFLLRRHFGSTLMAARARLGSGSVYSADDYGEDRKVFPNLRCVSGHGLKPYVDFGEFEDELNWFTFFRDPEKRFISHYVHQQTGGRSEYKMDFVEWARRFNRSNVHVRWIAGEEDLDAAKQILVHKFQAIGITEEFDRSIDHLVTLNNLEGFSKFLSKRKMVVRSREIKNDFEKNRERYADVIRECNALDQQLYDFALDQFSRQVDRYESHLSRFESTSQRVKVEGKKSSNPLRNFVNLSKFQIKDKLRYAPSVKLRSQRKSKGV